MSQASGSAKNRIIFLLKMVDLNELTNHMQHVSKHVYNLIMPHGRILLDIGVRFVFRHSVCVCQKVNVVNSMPQTIPNMTIKYHKWVI